MPIPSFPTGTREVIESIINDIGRDVTFITSTTIACTYSGDSLDPVTGTSTNSFCPVCSGNWYIPVWSGTPIIAHVTWKYSDLNEWHTGGYVFQGDGIIKVMYSGPYMEVINDTEYAVVNGKEVNIEKITLLGVPSINRIILDFKLREPNTS